MPPIQFNSYAPFGLATFRDFGIEEYNSRLCSIDQLHNNAPVSSTTGNLAFFVVEDQTFLPTPALLIQRISKPKTSKPLLSVLYISRTS